MRTFYQMRLLSILFFTFGLSTWCQAQDTAVSTDNQRLDLALRLFANGHNVKHSGIAMSDSVAHRPQLFQPSLAPTAFFCRLELNLDKSARLPLRFRLGDIDYTDALEGKNVVNPLLFTVEQRKQ
ncbi:MAG: hypothetical protein AAFR14_05130 [Bacteroidota bacterium]